MMAAFGLERKIRKHVPRSHQIHPSDSGVGSAWWYRPLEELGAFPFIALSLMLEGWAEDKDILLCRGS